MIMGNLLLLGEGKINHTEMPVKIQTVQVISEYYIMFRGKFNFLEEGSVCVGGGQGCHQNPHSFSGAVGFVLD